MPNKNYPESNKQKVYIKGQSMTKTNNKQSLDSIIEQFNVEVSSISPADADNTGWGHRGPTEPCAPIDEHSYTYVGEHYDTLPSDKHWTRQFASTELAVGITEAISYGVRDGLTNADVAVVLDKILSEVKQR
jgi:hypothetical protein